MSSYDIHPDLRPLLRIRLNLSKQKTPPSLEGGQRFFLPKRYTQNVRIIKHTLLGYQNHAFFVYALFPESCSNLRGGILLCHGGGFVTGLNTSYWRMAAHLCNQLNCAVFMPDYHLAPDYPFPHGLEDCFCTYLWIQKYGSAFGIPKNALAVWGDSAGGNLASSLCLLNRFFTVIQPRCLVLIQPTLDDTQSCPSAKQFTDTPVLNANGNAFAWHSYLHSWKGPVPLWAAPFRAKCLDGLPPTYIETSEFDPLRDEGLAFAKRLEQDGVSVFLNETKRTVHSFDLVFNSALAQHHINIRLEFLKKHLY